MDKQFIRILMLSVLLPAGAALAQAVQQEHLSFPAADRAVLSRLDAALPGAATKNGWVHTVATPRDQRVAHRPEAGSERP